MSAVMQDTLPAQESLIIMRPSLVCLCGLLFLQFLICIYIFSYNVALEGFTETLRKEMIPRWNIQVVLVELGGTNTAWKNHMTILPPLPVYDVDDSPTKQQRAMLGGPLHLIGNSAKVAKAFITISEKRKEVPVRIQLGTDSMVVVQHTAKKTIADSQKWEALSHSTNEDGTDVKEYTKGLLAFLG